MCVAESGMVNSTKEPQRAKASFPMWVTEFGMVKLAKELQAAKA